MNTNLDNTRERTGKSNFCKAILIFLLFFSFKTTMKAETCCAIMNGNWSAGTTWSCGHAPSDFDTILVPVGYSVTVDINSPVYCSMVVYIDGTLIFDVGQKINICPGEFNVSASGLLDGGVPGSKINMCGQTVWNGPGPEYGPLSWSSWPLPVTISSFEGIQNGNAIVMSWTTQSELNNNYFTLERCTNGIEFEEIGRINGNGTTNQPHSYSFNDLFPVEGSNYYRLKQTDFNGHCEIFRMISVNFGSSLSDCTLSVYPNPVEAGFTISFSDCNNEGITILRIIDPLGKIIMTMSPERNGRGGFSCTVDLNNNFKPGIYFIQSSSDKIIYREKIVIR